MAELIIRRKDGSTESVAAGTLVTLVAEVEPPTAAGDVASLTRGFHGRAT